MRPPLWIVVTLVLIALIGAGIVRSLGAPARVYSNLLVGVLPSNVAVDERVGHAFVTNAGSNTVSMVDTASGTILRTIAVGSAPTSMTVDSRRGRAFVLNSGAASMSALDTTTGRVLYTVPVRVFYQSGMDVAVDPQTGHVFIVGGADPGALSALTEGAGGLLHAADVGSYPQGMAVDPTTRRVFVADCGDRTVRVFDSASGRIVRTVATGRCPTMVAVDARLGRAFVTNASDNTVTAFDTRTYAVVRTVAVGLTPKTLAVDARTGRVFVVNSSDGTVSVLDALTGQVQRTVAVGADRPVLKSYTNQFDIAVDEKRDRVYVLNGGALAPSGAPSNGSVSVLDARTGQVRGTVAVGQAPVSLAVGSTLARLFVLNTGPSGSGDTSNNAWGWIPPALRPWLPWLTRPSSVAPGGSVTAFDTSRL